MRHLLIALLWCGGCTIENNVLSSYEPPARLDAEGCIDVQPGVVWFGEVVVGEDEPITEVLTVSNDCGGDLELLPLRLDPSGPFIAELDDGPLVEPGGTASITVTFDPLTDFDGSTWLTVPSEVGSVPVDLRAMGLAPVLSVEPEVEVIAATGCTSTTRVRVSNTGSVHLDIHAVELETASEDLAIGPLELTSLVPGQALYIPLEYTARDARPAAARLHIDSSDPLTPQAAVLVSTSSSEEGLFTEDHEVPLYGKVDVLWTLDRSG